ncbi:hypothetical protein AVEN_177224-1 [Araneus ventricosus]|uniref:Uncharacterized protein n=1 Tax=Araneus ventricosus TaxID=182803 RepID=A0A4Y2KYN7_ARAVE|nr:hypothetical protein AVEN_177224-1 [Araneus ventricosus]
MRSPRTLPSSFKTGFSAIGPLTMVVFAFVRASLPLPRIICQFYDPKLQVDKERNWIAKLFDHNKTFQFSSGIGIWNEALQVGNVISQIVP